MHFRSLLTVYLPAVEPDPEWEKEVADQVKQMRESQPEQLDSIGRKVMLDILYEGMNNISTTFGREVTPVIRDVMERFNCGTEDKRFLEFDDRTGEALRDYNATVDCMRLPDGRIVEEYPAPQWHKFIIKDGKVYQREAGPLHHPKRTKAAKKISVVPNYPRKKLYGNSFERYIEEATYKEKPYSIIIERVMVFPQAYAAVVPQSTLIMNSPRIFIVDVGGYTTDILLLKNGKLDFQYCRSLESGIITMNNEIIRKVNALHDMIIDDEHISDVLCGRETILPADVIETIKASSEAV